MSNTLIVQEYIKLLTCTLIYSLADVYKQGAPSEIWIVPVPGPRDQDDGQ